MIVTTLIILENRVVSDRFRLVQSLDSYAAVTLQEAIKPSSVVGHRV